MMGRRGFGRGIHPRGRPNFFGRDPGDLGDLFRRVGFRPLPQRLKSVAPVAHKILVVQLLLDQDADDPQRQCGVRARPDLEPQVRLSGQGDEAGIDDDELGPPLLGLEDVPAPGPMGRHRIGAQTRMQFAAR